MTLDEEDSFIQQIMANCDAAMAAAAASMTQMNTSKEQGHAGRKRSQRLGFYHIRWVNSMPLLSSYNCFACIEVGAFIESHICIAKSTEVMQTPSHPPIPN
jgi:hypothetical protein